jgi:hypothetical protein
VTDLQHKIDHARAKLHHHKAALLLHFAEDREILRGRKRRLERERTKATGFAEYERLDKEIALLRSQIEEIGERIRDIRVKERADAVRQVDERIRILEERENKALSKLFEIKDRQRIMKANGTRDGMSKEQVKDLRKYRQLREWKQEQKHVRDEARALLKEAIEDRAWEMEKPEHCDWSRRYGSLLFGYLKWPK